MSVGAAPRSQRSSPDADASADHRAAGEAPGASSLLTSSSSSAAAPPPSAVNNSSGSLLFSSLPSWQNRQRHWSVFYSNGIDEQPPCRLHYLYVGCWSTTSCDYFLHRNPQKGEVLGHTVTWLHNALPRDRFVFIITPVERSSRSLWGRLWTFIYGTPPAFALSRTGRKDTVPLHSTDSQARSKLRDSGITPPASPGLTHSGVAVGGDASSSSSALGVEVVEVLHADITALDYGPGLTSSRLAIETQTVSTHWFPHMSNVYAFYQCTLLPPASISCSGGVFHTGISDKAAGLLSVPQSQRATDRVRSPGLVPMQLSSSSSSSSAAVGSAPARKKDCLTVSPIKCEREALGANGEFSLPTASTTRIFAAKDLDDDEDDELHAQAPRSATLPPAGLEEPISRSNSPQTRAPSSPKLKEGISARNSQSSATSTESNERPSLLGEAKTSDLYSGNAHHGAPFGDLVAPVTTRHTNTMVVVSAQDPHFNAVLREVLMPEPGTHPYNASIGEQKRLLSLYEAGMPSWTIFISRWGLPYRRRYRLFFVMLINIWPVIALCVGLYDLYKHLPFVKDFMADALSPLSLWVNNHFVVYMSMLITYIFTVSFSVLHGFYMSVKGIMSVVSFVLYPFVPLFHLVLMLRYPLQMLWQLATLLLMPVYLVGSSVLGLVGTVVYTPILLLRTLVSLVGGSSSAVTATNIATSAGYFAMWWRSWLDFWEKVARPLKNVLKACYDGVIHVGTVLARREASIRRAWTSRVGLWVDVATTNFSILLSVRVLVVHCLCISVVAFVCIYVFWDALCETFFVSSSDLE
jgi:hypothetical protein